MGARAGADATMRGMLSSAMVLALGAFGGATVDAQGTGTVREARPITATPVEFPEPFSAVTRMAELREGRVVVWDEKDVRLSLVDLLRAEQREISRRGQGPLEYRGVRALLPTPGDSVLLYDTGNRRTMLIAPDGHPVRTTPFGEFSGMFGMGRMSPREADAAGNWYGEANSMRSQREWPGDTYEETVVRARPLSPRLDTITTVRRPKFHATRFSQGVITAKSFGILAGDPWGVFSDGSAIVVRADTYTPESIDRTGTRLGAAPIPFVSVRVSERDREEHLDSLRGVYRDARVTTRDGSPPRITANVLGPDTWQEFHPPVLGERIAVDSRERAWVHRLDARRADGERYDLLDRNGRFIDAIRLPKGTKFVAMGTNVWYGTREDEDGLVYLQRFPLP